MPANPAKTLLRPDNHSLLMIDHQYLRFIPWSASIGISSEASRASESRAPRGVLSNSGWTLARCLRRTSARVKALLLRDNFAVA